MLEFLAPLSGFGQWVLRIALAAVFIHHGMPKLKNPAMTGSMLGMPSFVGWTHGLVEVLGGLALVLGIFYREALFVLALIMAGAIWFKIAKWKTPFAAMDRTGWEFDLVNLGGLLTLLLG